MNNIYFGNRDIAFRDGFIDGCWDQRFSALQFSTNNFRAHQCTQCCGGVGIWGITSGGGGRMSKTLDNYHCLAGNNAIVSANFRCTNTFSIVRFGIHDGGGSAVTDGVYFELSSSTQRWDLRVMNNSTLATINGPARDNDYHEFTIDLTGISKAIFLIDGVKIDEMTTNFPTGVAGRSVACWNFTGKKESDGGAVDEEICAIRAAEGRYLQVRDIGMMT